ncbi:MAG: DUF1801 domain-containing protein [Saprospiraceae bacterium]
MSHSIKLTTDPRVTAKFESYPPNVRKRMNHLRDLILASAKTAGIEDLEETLKWGEPSYLAKKGSTLRMDWKPKKPDQYAMYFKCTSKLVLTFREVFGDFFTYEKNRAILVSFEEEVPEKELSACITAALTYHNVKQLPRLGIEID